MRPRPRSGWCARSGWRRRSRSGASPVARRGPSACSRPLSDRSMPGVRPESIGPVCAVTAWRTSTRRVGFGGSVAESGPESVVEGGGASVTPPNSTGAPPNLLPVTQPISFSPGLPETVLDPEPADALAALARRARRPRVRAARRRLRRSSDAGPASSTAGPASVSSPATRSRATPAPGSATTGASTASASRDGAARATCAGSTRPTAASCAPSTACASAAARSARPTKRPAAPSSSSSSSPAGTGSTPPRSARSTGA